MEALGPVVSYLTTASFQEALAREPRSGRRPFVTISRQAYAGGEALARALAARMEGEQDELFQGWRVLDRELCETVAGDKSLCVTLDSLAREDFRGPWSDYLAQVFAGTSPQLTIQRRVISLLRGAASMGRVVIVGRAGALATRDFPRGVHIRLVAPVPLRLARLRASTGEGLREAMARLADLDAARRRLASGLFRRDIDDPLLYDAVLNAAQLSAEEMADLIMRMVRQRMVRPFSEPLGAGS